jgi:hypothetical protein
MCSIKRSIAHVFWAAALSVCATATAFAQSGTAYPYGLDPYKPSDAWWLRNYGAVLVSQTPLLDLTKLDPYKPSDAALIRQLGGALPVWFGAMPLAPDRASGSATNLFVVQPSARSEASGSSAAQGQTPQTPMRSAIPPTGNDGVSIRFNGATWVAAGRAVALQSADFERAGEYANAPIYRLRANDSVIYVPTRDGMIAPFRRKQ